MIVRYVKKPVEVEALQIVIGVPLSEFYEFMGKDTWYTDSSGDVWIKTLEGSMKVSEGDYIIKGIKGEYYPCKPDKFEATYEKL